MFRPVFTNKLSAFGSYCMNVIIKKETVKVFLLAVYFEHLADCGLILLNQLHRLMSNRYVDK